MAKRFFQIGVVGKEVLAESIRNRFAVCSDQQLGVSVVDESIGGRASYAGSVPKTGNLYMSNQAGPLTRKFAIALGLLFLCIVQISSAQTKSFFPKRPPGVTVSHMRGVLVDYGIGNGSGSFTLIADNGKKVEFYTSWPMLIDGRPGKCSIAPTDTFKARARYCPDWSSDIRLGHSKVEATYWSSARDGEPVLVSDEIKKIQ